MTIQTFLSRHGEHWAQFKRDPMYRDLLDVLRTHDPARAMPAVNAKDATENAQNLLGRISGFNLCLNILESIIEDPIPVPPQETWAEPAE